MFYAHVHAALFLCSTRRLAALEACSGRPLTRLELEGAVPLSGAVAETVATCCPQLEGLRLVHKPTGALADGAPSEEEAFEYDYGCGQLLTLCGPRLRGLQLLGVHHWQALSYMAMRRCTALTSLELEAGLREKPFFHHGPYIGRFQVRGAQGAILAP